MCSVKVREEILQKAETTQTLTLNILSARCDEVKNSRNTRNAPYCDLCALSYTQLIHVSALLSHRLQEADTNIYLKHTEIEEVKITVHISWY
jgi:hypothetical protein